MSRHIELDVELDDVQDFFNSWYLETRSEILNRKVLNKFLRRSKSVLDRFHSFGNPCSIEQVYHNEMRRRIGELQLETEMLLNPQFLMSLSDLRSNKFVDFPRIVRQIEVRYCDQIDSIGVLTPALTDKYKDVEDKNEIRLLPRDEDKRRFYDQFCIYYSKIGNFLPSDVRKDYLSVTVVESSSDEGSYFNRTDKRVGVCINDVCESADDEFDQKALLLIIAGHEGWGHAGQLVMSKRADIPEFLTMPSGFTALTEDAIASYFEHRLLNCLETDSDLCKEFGLDADLAQVLRSAKTFANGALKIHCNTQMRLYKLGVRMQSPHVNFTDLSKLWVVGNPITEIDDLFNRYGLGNHEQQSLFLDEILHCGYWTYPGLIEMATVKIKEKYS